MALSSQAATESCSRSLIQEQWAPKATGLQFPDAALARVELAASVKWTEPLRTDWANLARGERHRCLIVAN
jgi:hypothetical protein